MQALLIILAFEQSACGTPHGNEKPVLSWIRYISTSDTVYQNLGVKPTGEYSAFERMGNTETKREGQLSEADLELLDELSSEARFAEYEEVALDRPPDFEPPIPNIFVAITSNRQNFDPRGTTEFVFDPEGELNADTAQLISELDVLFERVGP